MNGQTNLTALLFTTPLVHPGVHHNDFFHTTITPDNQEFFSWIGGGGNWSFSPPTGSIGVGEEGDEEGGREGLGPLESLTYSLPVMMIVGLVLFIVIVITAFGNFLVCLSLLRYRCLRTVSNFLIGNLAVSDFLLATTVLPLSSINECLGRWPFGRVLCNVWLLLDVLYCTASIWNICLIAFDRYTATLYPLWYRERRSTAQAALYVVLIWGIAAATCVPPLFGWNDLSQNYAVSNETSSAHCNPFQTPSYVLYSASVSFYIPFLLTFFLYVRIFVVLRQRLRKMRGERRGPGSGCGGCVAGGGGIGYARKQAVTADAVTCGGLTTRVGAESGAMPDWPINGSSASADADHYAVSPCTRQPARATSIKRCVPTNASIRQPASMRSGSTRKSQSSSTDKHIATFNDSDVNEINYRHAEVEKELVAPGINRREGKFDTSPGMKQIDGLEEDRGLEDGAVGLENGARERLTKGGVAYLEDEEESSWKSALVSDSDDLNSTSDDDDEDEDEDDDDEVTRDETELETNKTTERGRALREGERDRCSRGTDKNTNPPVQLPRSTFKSRWIMLSTRIKEITAEPTSSSSAAAATTAAARSLQPSSEAAAAAAGQQGSPATARQRLGVMGEPSSATSTFEAAADLSDKVAIDNKTDLAQAQPQAQPQPQAQMQAQTQALTQSTHLINILAPGIDGKVTSSQTEPVIEDDSKAPGTMNNVSSPSVTTGPSSGTYYSSAQPITTSSASPRSAHRRAPSRNGRGTGGGAGGAGGGPGGGGGGGGGSMKASKRGSRGVNGGRSVRRGGPGGGAGLDARKRAEKREARATIRMAAIIGVFCGMWVGFFTVYVVHGVCPDDCPIPRWLDAFFFWLGYANSAINPILYTIFNEEFRRAFKKLLIGWCNPSAAAAAAARRSGRSLRRRF